MIPRVSVIMPAFNAEMHLRDSIDSILRQTFRDFELIIIDDGSKDCTAEIALSYSDDRIRYIQNSQNFGIPKTRNIGIKEAQGEYIAWLDSDDISHVSRLERQVQLLDNNKEIGICGSWVQTIGTINGVIWKNIVEPEVLRCQMIFNNPIANSSVMLRKQLFIDFKIQFDLSYPYAEDYDLWERLSNHCKMTNISEILVYYRTHETQTTFSEHVKFKMQECVEKIRARQFMKFGILEDESKKMLDQVVNYLDISWEDIEDIHVWFTKLIKTNIRLKLYNEKALQFVLGEKWYLISSNAISEGFVTPRNMFMRVSVIYGYNLLSIRQRVNLFVRLIIYFCYLLYGSRIVKWIICKFIPYTIRLSIEKLFGKYIQKVSV